MMTRSEEIAARETLRRLEDVLNEPPFEDGEDEVDALPSEAEARAVVERLGIDVPALAARIREQVAAFEAARAESEPEAPAARPADPVPPSVHQAAPGPALPPEAADTVLPDAGAKEGKRPPPPR